jgi:hypothetical protein
VRDRVDRRRAGADVGEAVPFRPELAVAIDEDVVVRPDRVERSESFAFSASRWWSDAACTLADGAALIVTAAAETRSRAIHLRMARSVMQNIARR